MAISKANECYDPLCETHHPKTVAMDADQLAAEAAAHASEQSADTKRLSQIAAEKCFNAEHHGGRSHWSRKAHIEAFESIIFETFIDAAMSQTKEGK